MRFVVTFCAVAALSAPLAGCLTASDLSTASEALNVASSALNVASAVSNDETPAAVPAAAPARAMSTPALKPSTAKLPQSSGTTQRSAFEDCAKLYQANGRPDLAQQCTTRANNMSTAR